MVHPGANPSSREDARSRTADAPLTGYIVPRLSWPRPATPTSLVPVWAGEFSSFNDWVSFAAKRLTGTYDPLTGVEVNAICIDSVGRRCIMGAHFARARDEGTFPVRYFWDCCIDDGASSRHTGQLRDEPIPDAPQQDGEA